MPRVSVCCAVKNQSDLLAGMIDSVVKQSFTDWELIVVDDGSTEDIKAVCDSFKDGRIRVIRFDENRGIPHGINRAMEEAAGEYVNPLAADELLTPGKLTEQVEYLDEHEGIEAIWGLPGNGPVGLRPSYEQFLLRAHNRSREAWLRTLLNLENIPIGGAGMLVRKSVFSKIGYFDPQLAMFSDHEWFVRFFKAGCAGRVLPYRWALSREPNPDSSPQNAKNFTREMHYIRSKHDIEIPSLDPTVTVGIPVYNMARWIGQCLDSLLAQTVKPTEIIVIDDCSTDNIAEVMAQYAAEPSIQFMRMEENAGNMKAQNYMISVAKGNFYLPFSADDVLAPDFIESCLAEYRANPWLEFVASQCDFIDGDGKAVGNERLGENVFYNVINIAKPVNQTRENWLKQLYYGNVYFGAGIYRTSALRDVGGWDVSCGVISDYEMYLKLLQRENIRIVEKALTHTRLHDKNMSNMSVNKPSASMNLEELYAYAKAPYYPKRMKVVIATPFYEMKGYSPYIASLAQTIRILTQLGIEHEYWCLDGDSYVSRARNTICTKFLENPENTDLFFLDSDMSWNPEAFVRMLMLPEEMVAASYPVKNLWEQWTSLPVLKEDETGLHPIGRPLQDGSALIAADTIATGFCRIKRSVLERFRDTYPELRYQEPGADPGNRDRYYIEFFSTGRQSDGLWYGEDRMFCRKLKEMGEDIYIYPNADIGHFGIKGWKGNFDTYLRGQNRANVPATDSPGV